ncbi:helix-turn-helix transcriptional regulator [Providencia stuartii]|uniref:XRE family transcriptional regulator n=1 Tax=Providencia stuartii TaxID=588 RepID=UPI0024AC2971|nr:helix-turn-helix transcriptional regulator [Providencia stuartii]EMA3643514.1 helix-turn-helix transcriptional regulator [Providencia stuartii]MBW3103090.1 helix-turn-helix transcriptional regulator [Providencia stuartii]MCB5219724.1 helix-turn-helix transcriptional regulator [Providencia stuartii]MEB3135047.1 helix-turn-helix transcriptional regulator [Providencia stuartii]HEM8185944.1 helix-turn-helix transcriptional regulator [Providencia stuartii]
MKTTLAQRLKQARKNAGITQNELAKLVGVSQAAIQKIETGKAATSTRLIEISKALNVDPEWLSVGTGDNPAPHISSSVKIELADDVGNIERYRVEVLDVEASAGEGVIVIDDFIETITSIEYSVEEAKRLFGGRPSNTIKMITVKGDSMAETFEPRDQIFVDITTNFFDGDGIYVFVLDNQLYIKRLQKQYKRLAVISDNPRYETWYLDEDALNGLYICAKVLVSQSITYKFHS